jgi:hypothetical protein
VQAEGEITFIDDSRAAGLYAELESGDCIIRLWVDRTRWNTWSADEQALFSVGKPMAVDGILTLVLNEPVVDLSMPPRLR